jgi:methylated-DNA-[protein]-cysteine S-methyltransferase
MKNNYSPAKAGDLTIFLRVMNEKRPEHSLFYDLLETPLGTVYIIFRSSFLTGIDFQKPAGLNWKRTPDTSQLRNELGEYFAGTRREFGCKTSLAQGTDFEKKVWEMLRSVPYGETRTYKWLAERIGKPGAFRAVGNALGKNPIPIIYPCHRIIEADGSLGGYSPGPDIKRRLLKIEYYTKLSKT